MFVPLKLLLTSDDTSTSAASYKETSVFCLLCSSLFLLAAKNEVCGFRLLLFTVLERETVGYGERGEEDRRKE